MSAAEVIAKCVESDYNRTFHDAALCILGDLKRAGFVVVELPIQMTDRTRVADVLRSLPMWASGDSRTGDAWTCLREPDLLEFEADGQQCYGELNIASARHLAAALLAAAQVADDGQLPMNTTDEEPQP